MAYKKRVSVDREEYEALCDLRDEAHVRLQLQKIEVDEQFKTCLAINRDQCARLNLQDLQLADLRIKLTDMAGRAITAEARADKAEACVRALEPSKPVAQETRAR